MDIFVVIKAGYEGIEGLLYASTNEIESVLHVQKLRQNILHDKAKMESCLQYHGKEEDDDYNNEWDRWYLSGKIDDEEYSNGKYEEPDSICIQKWDGKQFSCVCSELDVAPSKTWLM